MIKYIDAKTGYNLIKFDKENDKIEMLDNFGTNIDYMWIADEEGMLDDIHVNIGDLIIRMYGCNGKINDRKTLVIKDEQLKNYYNILKEKVEARKAECEKCCECDTCGCTDITDVKE